MYENEDSIVYMMEFTEILKNEPKKAYDYISNNSHCFRKDDVVNILKEVLYSIKYYTDCRFYGDLYKNILGDVQIELDEKYDEEYQEYQRYIDELNRKVPEINR